MERPAGAPTSPSSKATGDRETSDHLTGVLKPFVHDWFSRGSPIYSCIQIIDFV